MISSTPSGIVTPILTPYNDDLSIATDLYQDHCRHVLADGCHFVSPFGTTGEALSVGMSERMVAVDSLIDSGAARPDQMIPGTGLTSLQDTVTLTRHALDAGCAGVMTLPPFYYVNASDEGLFHYFAALIEAIADDRLKICLYHIPAMAGIGFSAALTGRLRAEFPDQIVAYKDSDGKFDHTRAVIDAAPGLAVFPGSELFLFEGMKVGGAGCISATCNVNARQIRQVYDLAAAGDFEAAEPIVANMKTIRKAIQDRGLIPALKSIRAAETGDQRWLNLRAPLLNADPAIGPALLETINPSR